MYIYYVYLCQWSMSFGKPLFFLFGIHIDDSCTLHVAEQGIHVHKSITNFFGLIKEYLGFEKIFNTRQAKIMLISYWFAFYSFILVFLRRNYCEFF